MQWCSGCRRNGGGREGGGANVAERRGPLASGLGLPAQPALHRILPQNNPKLLQHPSSWTKPGIAVTAVVVLLIFYLAIEHMQRDFAAFTVELWQLGSHYYRVAQASLISRFNSHWERGSTSAKTKLNCNLVCIKPTWFNQASRPKRGTWINWICHRGRRREFTSFLETICQGLTLLGGMDWTAYTSSTAFWSKRSGRFLLQLSFAQCAMCFCIMFNVLLHNVQQTTAILPHSSCVCQPASWHYHQSKAFLDLVGGAAGSYCAGPIFCPQKMWVKMAKLGANLDCSVCTNLTKIRSISLSQYLIELSATAHKRAIII